MVSITTWRGLNPYSTGRYSTRKRQIDIKLHENALYKETNELLSDMLNSMTYQEKQKINGIRLSDDREISVEGNSVLILDDFEYSSIMNLNQSESKYIIDILLFNF